MGQSCVRRRTRHSGMGRGGGRREIGVRGGEGGGKKGCNISLCVVKSSDSEEAYTTVMSGGPIKQLSILAPSKKRVHGALQKHIQVSAVYPRDHLLSLPPCTLICPLIISLLPLSSLSLPPSLSAPSTSSSFPPSLSTLPSCNPLLPLSQTLLPSLPPCVGIAGTGGLRLRG